MRIGVSVSKKIAGVIPETAAQQQCNGAQALNTLQIKSIYIGM